MYMLGTLILAFGWFGFNTGCVPSASDTIVARVAVNTVLASTAGSLAALTYTWLRFGKPDPSFLCNGTLAGLVAITASCAYVEPWAAVAIGSGGGLLVIWSCLFVERVLGIDDPVGAISVHGTSGLWGAIALGLFADGSYAPAENFNGVAGNVTGLFYGSPGQLVAQFIGVLANLLWALPAAYGVFWVTARYIGNRVSASAELQGLDIGELGAIGYIAVDTPEVRPILRALPEPRPATIPTVTDRRFSVVVEGVEPSLLNRVWSDLCQTGDKPPHPELLAVYPYVTTIKDNRFRFRGGEPQRIRSSLERLLREQLASTVVRARLESID
jgi:Amt family ammonium transporter